MAYFKVVLHGTGLNIPLEGAGAGIIGFYATRLVRAPTVTGAEAKAKQLVESEWSEGGKYWAHGGAGLCLFVESVNQSTFVDRSFANRGYSFYSSNGELDA